MRKIFQLLMIVVVMGLTPVFTACDEITASGDNPVPTTPTTDDATQAGDKDDETQTEIKVEGVTITGFTSDSGTTASTTVTVGTSLNLGIAIEPAELKDIEVVWKSGNEGIVKVSSDGVVTAVAPGQAVVTVSLKADAKISATLTITVIEEVKINNEPVDQSAAEARG
ncbi:MAG: hypothetical protein E7103_08815 [Prevotella sp.]|jgi:uncharacterized protein YjdB|nr:hypothetical protein [Prevotella sp.]